MLATAASSVEQLHPACYAAYMLATSFGVPVRVAACCQCPVVPSHS